MSCDWRRAGHVTTVLPSDWCRYPSMQELGEALVSVLDSLNIEYVVGLGEGAGANILARWSTVQYSTVQYSTVRGWAGGGGRG